MAQVITLIASVALGISGASFHEPFHADGRQRSMTVTERSHRDLSQRFPSLTMWSDGAFETAESGPCWIKRRWVRRSLRRALALRGPSARPRRPGLTTPRSK